MKDLITNKIEEIIQVIEKTPEEKIGLLDGKSGLVLFYFFISKYHNTEQYNEKIINLIDEINREINNNNYVHTFCSGVCGFAWLLNFLVHEDFLDIEDISFLKDVDEFLFEKTLNDISINNIDFLHGLIGTGIYFTSRVDNNPKVVEYIIEIIKYLNKIKIEDNNFIKWTSRIHINDKNNESSVIEGINLGLSHGLPSILTFLSKTYKKGIDTKRVKKFADGLFNFILSNQSEVKENLNIFPSTITINENSITNQLAWCYGDLGLSMALLNSARIFGNKDYENIAIEILKHASKKKNINLVNNSGICHGTSGIAHIFKRAWLLTKENDFLESSNYWYNETLKLSKYSDGLAGYKAYFFDDKNIVWYNSISLLEGVGGIGLSLLHGISDIEPSWDECLLLS